jgi:Holliday junction resolvase RusA-like endonuclease
VELTVPGEPRSKARPRFTGNGGVYSDKQQKAHEELLEWHLRLAFKQPFEAGVGVGMTFFRSNRQRIDLDNLVKAVLDAANGVAFVDDVQVVELAARIDLDPRNPRTVILIEPKKTSMPRGNECDEERTCPTCNKAFTFRAKIKPIHCSRACASKARRKLIELSCLHCGKAFKPGSSYQKLCSPSCRSASLKAKRKAKARPAGHCEDCGKETSKPSYKRCRACWKKARRRDIAA